MNSLLLEKSAPIVEQPTRMVVPGTRNKCLII